jgi:glyoxylase-like metal-dependent hydrolase (beta-lactamase superfamily II)
VLIAAGNASAWTGPTGNNTYLLNGVRPALIDAGVGRPEHIAAVATALAGHPLAAVLITHGHVDHVAGLPALVERWPSVRVRNARGDAFADQERIEAGDTRLRAIHTPGHAPDHFCLLDEDSGDLYCGDLARIGGTIVIPASKGGDLAEYLASLQKVRALGPRRLLPGHGPVIEDPEALIGEYLEHRARRERQVLDALTDGCSTPRAIVRQVYGSLADGLGNAAEDGVVAQLVKLQREGRVRRLGQEWLIAPVA